jgi:hypothetical protein
VLGIAGEHLDRLFDCAYLRLLGRFSRRGRRRPPVRLSYVDDEALLYLGEVMKVSVQDLFPSRTPGNRIHDVIENLETTRF